MTSLKMQTPRYVYPVVAAVLCGAFVVGISGCDERAPVAKSKTKHSSVDLAYAIEYGQEWNRSPADARTRSGPMGNVDFFLRHNDRDTNFWIVANRHPLGDTTLSSDTAAAWEDATLSYPGCVKISSKDITLDGEPARRLEYRLQENGDQRNFIAVLMIKGPIMYIAFGSCTSDRKDASGLEGKVDELLGSFVCQRSNQLSRTPVVKPKTKRSSVDLAYEIEYGQEWNRSPADGLRGSGPMGNVDIFLHHSDGDTEFWIVATRHPFEMTTLRPEFIDVWQGRVLSYPGTVKISSKDITLDGEPARRLEYRNLENGDERHFIEVLMIKGPIMYVAVGSWSSDRKDASGLEGKVEELLASFVSQ